MSRKAKNVNPLVKKIFQENDIQNIADAQSLMKDMFKDMVSLLLEDEMEEALDYSKYERNSAANNSRNDYNDKKVKTTLGEVELDIPRDRKRTFEPQVIPKYSRAISDIGNKIISIYGCGMSTTDINDHLEEIYDISFSPTQISRITDKVMEEANQWKSRTLKSYYPFVFLDGLPGFKEAIRATYPDTKVQRCIVHQIRNTLRFLNYKDRKIFAQELKDIYRAHDAESGFDSLERLNKEYPKYFPALKS